MLQREGVRTCKDCRLQAPICKEFWNQQHLPRACSRDTASRGGARGPCREVGGIVGIVGRVQGALRGLGGIVGIVGRVWGALRGLEGHCKEGPGEPGNGQAVGTAELWCWGQPAMDNVSWDLSEPGSYFCFQGRKDFC